MLDFVQDRVSEIVIGNEIDEPYFTSAIVSFLSTKHNSHRAWQYLVRLYSKEKFEFHQSEIVRNAASMGKEKSLNWLSQKVIASRDKKVKKSLVTMFNLFAHRIPNVRDKVLNMVARFLDDEHEDIRALALIPYYFFAQDGPQWAVKALGDRFPMVRVRAFELLSGVYNMNVNDNWEVEAGEEREPDPLLTSDLVNKLLEDQNEIVVVAAAEFISDMKIHFWQGVDIAKLAFSQTEEVREIYLKMIAMNDIKENQKKLLGFALKDSSEFVREDAIEAIKESKLPISSERLRLLYEKETVSRVKDELDRLILEKGDSSIPDIYYQILDRSLESWYNEKALEKILKSGNLKYINMSLDLCEKHGKCDLVAKQFSNVLEAGFLGKAELIFYWCLENKKELEHALLAAGKLPKIPIETIASYYEDENLIIRTNALRATENRLHNGKSLKKLKDLYIELKPQVKEQNYEANLATLSIIDGILEFEGREEAIKLLKEYYEIATQVSEGSFLIRSAWELLKILGVTLPHPVYENSGPTVPYLWPDSNGPFYAKINEDFCRVD